MKQTRTHRLDPAQARLAAVAWLAAGLIYVTLEAIAAAAYPGYSYARNYISDLGVSAPGKLYSPLHTVMNDNFIANGVLFFLAGVLIFRATAAIGGWPRALFLLLAILHSIGIVLVGSFHESSQAATNEILPLHTLGAAMAIIGGNAAVIVAGLGASRYGAPNGYRIASVLIGGLGLVCLAILLANASTTTPGVPERGSVYSITIWELMTGCAILVAGRRRAFAAGGSFG